MPLTNTNQKTEALDIRVLNGRFELRYKLGEGGMGVVYQAIDRLIVEADSKNCTVAVKILSENFKKHTKAFQTMQRETAKSRSLSHPNIVRVHDFDRDSESGDVFMTMEYLEGNTLEQLLAKSPNGLPLQQAWLIIFQIASALQYAHSKRIVHLDLKPGNIFLTNDNEVKILDFGVARVLKSERSVPTNFDVGTLHAMSLSYASLEMLNNEEPDIRDDIYAFALIAYKLFTGHHPFKMISARQASEEGLKPERIAALSQKEWSLISLGLELQRSNRLNSIDDFLKKLKSGNKSPVLVAAVVSLVLGTMVTGYYFDDENSIDIPKNPVKASDGIAENSTNSTSTLIVPGSTDIAVDSTSKYFEPNRLRMAVIPFTVNNKIENWKKPDEFLTSMTQSLVSFLTQTRKFAILDRENISAQDSELSLASLTTEKLASFGKRLSTDYIIVGNVNNIHYEKSSITLKVSGKTVTTIRQGASISYRIIDVETGEIKFADAFDEILFSSSSNMSSSTVAKKAAFSIGDTILNAIFPIRVESVNGEQLFLGQGGKTLRKNDTYSLIMFGKKLKDSYTGESLGKEEINVGTVRITNVQAKTSTARIIKTDVNVAELFEPGLFILRPETNALQDRTTTNNDSFNSFEKGIADNW